MSDLTYELNDSLYINLTNRCNNSCTFCIKYRNRVFEDKYSLWLTKEPIAEEIIADIPEPSKYRQIVFCGYGEPLIRLDTLIKVAEYLKGKGASVRIDTDGQANLFHGRNILPQLKGLIDEVMISLNAQDSETYNRLCRPVFSGNAYSSLKDFACAAKEFIPKVSFSVVDLPGVDKEKCSIIANKTGIELRVRPYYESRYKA